MRCLLCFALLCDTARLTMKVYATQPCCAKSRDVFLSPARCAHLIPDAKKRSFPTSATSNCRIHFEHSPRNRLRDKPKSFTQSATSALGIRLSCRPGCNYASATLVTASHEFCKQLKEEATSPACKRSSVVTLVTSAPQ